MDTMDTRFHMKIFEFEPNADVIFLNLQSKPRIVKLSEDFILPTGLGFNVYIATCLERKDAMYVRRNFRVPVRTCSYLCVPVVTKRDRNLNAIKSITLN